MRSRSRGIMIAAALVALSAGISVAGASTKFAYVEEITDSASLVVDFEEGSQKRFPSVDYRLEADVISTWGCTAGESVTYAYHASATFAGSPDSKGRVIGRLTIDMTQSPGPLLCFPPRYLSFTNVKLANLTSGRVYNLDSIATGAPA